MNAYFTASIAGKKLHQANYQRIIDILKSHKIPVQSDHIMKETEQSVSLQTKNQRLAFHRQLEKWISSATFMVVEATFPSISVGYEISLALHMMKPVLVLYSEGDPPSLLAYHQDEHLVCEKYTPASLKEIIEEFIVYAESGSDSRFTFYITPQIGTFLKKISRQQKIPKSVYIRKLIEEKMRSKI